MGLFYIALSTWLFGAGSLWSMYIALEPFVRRRWPEVLVGWSRLLAGNYRDPLVGRDLLIGCGVGILVALLYYLPYPLANLFDAPAIMPFTGDPLNVAGLGTLDLFSGGQAIIVMILETVLKAIYYSLLVGFIFFLIRILFRSTWAAAAGLILLVSVPLVLQQPSPISAIATLFVVEFLAFLWFRFDFLALAAEIFSSLFLLILPITWQSIWYRWYGFVGLALLLAFAFYSFHTSLGGQPMFGRTSLED
jgi:hypothetical protein